MIDAATVSLWGKHSTPIGPELELMNRVISGVIEHIERYYEVDDPMTDGQEHAGIMQASRLWRRRQSLDGVAAFSNDFAIRVSSLDPDVEKLLEFRFDFA